MTAMGFEVNEHLLSQQPGVLVYSLDPFSVARTATRPGIKSLVFKVT